MKPLPLPQEMPFNLLNVVYYLKKTELVRVLDNVYSDKIRNEFSASSKIGLIRSLFKNKKYVFPLILITAFE